MIILQLLALGEQLLNYVYPYWEDAKQSLRDWLGPTPLTYHLLKDGRVLSSTIVLPDEIKSETYAYWPIQKQMTKLLTLVDGRYKPLPIIGIVLKTSQETIDISDWLGDIRAYPVPEQITAKQILLLWSLVQNRYVEFEGSTVEIVKNDGSQETITL